jgi:hypothetical protein
VVPPREPYHTRSGARAAVTQKIAAMAMRGHDADTILQEIVSNFDEAGPPVVDPSPDAHVADPDTLVDDDISPQHAG